LTDSADLAGQGYWDDLWSTSDLPAPIDPSDPGVANYVNRGLAAYFDEALGEPAGGDEILEVGCARSAWLPYFACRYQLAVCGLDYSPGGCEMERAVLAHAGVSGEVFCADFFDPPEHLLNRYAAVVSLGVVEHFTDTQACLTALAALLKPGGRLLTVIPNMAGLLGAIERRINPAVYRIHVPLTPAGIAAAHERAGLEVRESKHLLATNFGVLNLNGLPDTRKTRALEHARKNLARLSKLVWLLETKTRPLPTSRALSPYVVCTATKHADRSGRPRAA
jgi:2-polyprenyl-3-methyl-5-hydroxy-6-metoxy-1,4-benzoquinol methylase